MKVNSILQKSLSYLMNGNPLAELIILQSPLASLNSETAFARKDPLVSFLKADAAVAFCYFFQFRNFDGEFEGAAVTVSVVGLELAGVCGLGLGHNCAQVNERKRRKEMG